MQKLLIKLTCWHAGWCNEPGACFKRSRTFFSLGLHLIQNSNSQQDRICVHCRLVFLTLCYVRLVYKSWENMAILNVEVVMGTKHVCGDNSSVSSTILFKIRPAQNTQEIWLWTDIDLCITYTVCFFFFNCSSKRKAMYWNTPCSSTLHTHTTCGLSSICLENLVFLVYQASLV